MKSPTNVIEVDSVSNADLYAMLKTIEKRMANLEKELNRISKHFKPLISDQ